MSMKTSGGLAAGQVETTMKACAECGGLFRLRLSLVDRIEHCTRSGCLEARQQQRDRDVVMAWERMNSGVPDGEGFFVPHLEDKHGRFRPWYKLPHLRDLAKEYRIYERLAALKAAGKKRGSEKEVNALNRAPMFEGVARDLLGDDCLVIAPGNDGEEAE